MKDIVLKLKYNFKFKQRLMGMMEIVIQGHEATQFSSIVPPSKKQ